MKIKSSLLAEKLKQLAPAIPVNGKLPVLENVLIKDEKISATNQHLTIISKIPLKEQILLPFKPLQNILNEIGSQEIVIEQTETEITLTAGEDVFSLGKPNDIDIYPQPQEVDYDKEIRVGNLFFAAMQNASKHESQNEQLTVHGINLLSENGRIEIAGTDTTTIYVARFPFDEVEFTAHIDSLFCRALDGWNIAQMSFAEKFVACRNDDCEIRIQMLETKYPNYGAYMPDEVEVNCVVKKKELETAIRKCLVFGGEIKTVRLVFGDDHIDMEYKNAETAHKTSTSVMAEHSVEEGYEIGLSAELIQRALSSLDADAEQITFCIPEEADKPVYIQHDNILILIVPSVI